MTADARFDTPGIVYLNRGELGPASFPILAYYPYHGIYVSLYLRTLYFGLHVPLGTVVQLNDKTIRVEGTTKSGPYSTSFDIRAAPLSYLGDGKAQQFKSLPDLYSTSDNFGPLTGTGNGYASAWYLFMGFRPGDPKHLVGIPKGLIDGTIVMPSLTINGERYEAQRLPFKKKHFVALECVNC